MSEDVWNNTIPAGSVDLCADLLLKACAALEAQIESGCRA